MENEKDLEKKINSNDFNEFGFKNEPGIEYVKSEEKIIGTKNNLRIRICILKRDIASGIVLSYIYSFHPVNKEYSLDKI